jgi:hypothetical protein
MRVHALSRARCIMPPFPVVVVFLGAFLILEAPIILSEWRLGGRLAIRMRPATILLFFGALNYGILRVYAFHPVGRPGYRTWLESTPWTSRKPLPMGPVELVWEDGLVVGPLMLLCATQPEPPAVHLLCAFLMAYLLALTLSFVLTREWALGYATAFAVGVPIWLWHQPLACLAALAAVYLIAYEGLRRVMARFPWEQLRMPNLDSTVPLQNIFTPGRPRCGWPYDRMLTEIVDDRGFRRIDAVLGCVLVSWWFYVLTSLVRDPVPPGRLCVRLDDYRRSDRPVVCLHQRTSQPAQHLGTHLDVPVDHPGLRPGVHRPALLDARRTGDMGTAPCGPGAGTGLLYSRGGDGDPRRPDHAAHPAALASDRPAPDRGAARRGRVQ